MEILVIYISLKDDLSEDMWKKKLSEAMEIMYDKANKLNGQVSGEHGIGYARKKDIYSIRYLKR